MTSIECPNCGYDVPGLGNTGVCDSCETNRASIPPPDAEAAHESAEARMMERHWDAYDSDYKPVVPRVTIGDLLREEYEKKHPKVQTVP